MEQKTFSEIIKRFADIQFNENFDLIVAIANGGIVPAGIINQKLNMEVEILHINFRDDYQQPKYSTPKLLKPIEFEFQGKKILLVDDRIKTGATIDVAKKLLEGAKLIKTFAVNGNADYALYNESCFRFPWRI
ncbi:phosphoribosyltransferase [Porphyromonadaceae sp. NP-X]|jgi:xanthine phosphoribosyltransferase|nr:phosphoribosyltransferase [Paludibacteraceae bacterium]MBP9017445.1 phosphoribosyltransferase [Paludibacteraceae bacterium]MDS1031878.1 phosphoribosyltransferase [Porphyromonadaceae sp. NP-X]